MKKNLGKRLKLIRTELSLKYTQKEFAELLGTSASYISELEKGKSAPGGEFLLALNQGFKVNINWLLTGEGEVLDDQDSDEIEQNIMIMLKGMSEEKKREVLKYTEEKKLLAEYLKQKSKKLA